MCTPTHDKYLNMTPVFQGSEIDLTILFSIKSLIFTDFVVKMFLKELLIMLTLVGEGFNK